MTKLRLVTPSTDSTIATNIDRGYADILVKAIAAEPGIHDIDAIYTDENGDDFEFDFDRNTFGPPTD
jgi:hypothetical protein